MAVLWPWLLFFGAFLLGSIDAAPIHDGEVGLSEKCIQCHFAVELAEKKWGDEALDCLGDLVVYLCEGLQIEPHYICRAFTTNYADEVVYVLETVITTPKEVCSLLVDNCGTFFDPLNATWHMPMPAGKPPVIEKTVIPAGKPTMRVLHLTDLHIDKDYQIGTEAKCTNTFSLCCRPPDDPDELSLNADIIEPAGHWGTVGMCDAPYWFVDDMLGQIAQKHNDVAYILLTGDLESHAIWDYTKEEHAQRIANVSRLIKQHFPNKPVYFAIGNHEGVPLDSFAPHFTPQEYHMDWLYDTVADSWNYSIPQDQLDLVRYNGCYMKKLFPGLRLISLNNGYGDSMNLYLMVNQTDPDGAMSWFINQLLEAEKAGDKVHIIAHIPGGTPEGLEGWSLNYYRAIIRFENTISGQFFGHVHSEQFYMFYENPEDPTSRPVDVIYSAPSVTAYSRYNPAYRIYTIDGNYPGASYRVIDWEDYMFNLTTNNQPPFTPTWTTLYPSVVQEYGMKGNLPSEWNTLINRMKTDDALFTKFLKNFYRRTDYPQCDAKCRREYLCDLRKAHHSSALCPDFEGATGRRRDDVVSPKRESTGKKESVRRLRYSSQDKCQL